MPQTPVKELTNSQLLINLRELLRRERRLTLAVIEYLCEVEHRRLHLERGYSAMFYFCTRALGYSESAANRRIRSARAIRRFPQIRNLLETRKLTMSLLCVIAGELTPENADRLLESVCGKSTREAWSLLAQIRPVRRTYERIRPVAVLSRSANASERSRSLFKRDGAAEPGIPATPHAPPGRETIRRAADSASPVPPAPGIAPESPPHREDPNPSPVERKYTFEFSGSPVFLQKYQRVASLYSRRTVGRVTIETVFEGLMDDYIVRNDPRRREERRVKRAQSTGKGTTPAATEPGTPASNVQPTRHVSAAVRDQIHERDGGRCTYVSPDGRRCENRYNLQVDHIKPHALGGGNERTNLRLLCAAHNRLVAEKVFGRAHMDRFSRDK